MTLKERITPAQIDDLKHRRVTTRAMAKELGVTESHLSRMFPGKIPGPVVTAKAEKVVLRAARENYRNSLAQKVLNNDLTVQQAADTAYCCTRTMFRHIAKVRNGTA